MLDWIKKKQRVKKEFQKRNSEQHIIISQLNLLSLFSSFASFSLAFAPFSFFWQFFFLFVAFRTGQQYYKQKTTHKQSVFSEAYNYAAIVFVRTMIFWNDFININHIPNTNCKLPFLPLPPCCTHNHSIQFTLLCCGALFSFAFGLFFMCGGDKDNRNMHFIISYSFICAY